MTAPKAARAAAQKARLLVAAFAACLTMPAAAADFLPRMAKTDGTFFLELYPGVDTGTHVQRAGLSLRALAARDLGPVDLRGGIVLADKFALDYLGLPGASNVASFGFDAVAGLGPSTKAPAPWNDLELRRALELRFEWLSYLDFWGTSQYNGRFSLVFAGPRKSFGITFQNDLFGFGAQDEWRTAAAEIACGFAYRGDPAAASLGVKLYTGSHRDSKPLHRGQTYPTEMDLPGADVSDGILYVGLRRGRLSLEAGWDSEAIRNAAQNGLHWLINDGSIPLLDRPDRLYIELSIYPDGDLY